MSEQRRIVSILETAPPKTFFQKLLDVWILLFLAWEMLELPFGPG